MGHPKRSRVPGHSGNPRYPEKVEHTKNSWAPENQKNDDIQKKQDIQKKIVAAQKVGKLMICRKTRHPQNFAGRNSERL